MFISKAITSHDGGVPSLLKANLKSAQRRQRHQIYLPCERNLIISFTDPPSLFFPIWKKTKMKKKIIYKFGKFFNNASCLHKLLSQRTAASNTECKKINKKEKDLNKCVILIRMKQNWFKDLNKNWLTRFSLPLTQNFQ